ncbi:MAG: FixH family protein [Ferruginibacter sp.]
MNWGYKILFVYIIFVSGIVFMVFRSSMQNQDLVTQDYYEQELKFQDRIEETERANALSATVKYGISNNELWVRFPKEMNGVQLSADILLYCIADKSKDIHQDSNTQNASVQVPLPVGCKGSYELKIIWKANGVGYYYQHKLIIP